MPMRMRSAMEYVAHERSSTTAIRSGGARDQSDTGLEKASFAYLPALDGMRAVSVMLVLVAHAGLQRIVPGGLGVVVFFVISGFLLTRQMIAEIEHTGTLNTRAFYLRRAFRLVPALIVYMLLFNLLLWSLGANIPAGSVLSGLFYWANYYSGFVHTSEKWSPNGILWSLAVEEHFYIVFPWVMIAFSRNLRKVIPVLGVVVMAVLIWRTILHFTCASSPYSFVCGIYDTDRIFHGTDSIIDCIAYGALAALVLHYHTRAVRRTLTGGPMLIAAATCLLASLLIRNSLFRDTVRFSLQSASVSILILNILFDRSGLQLKRALSWPLSILVGRLSYSLYLFHFGVLMLILALRQSTNLSFLPSVMAAYFIGSFACAGASYWLIEKPMVRVRRRIGAHTAS